MRLTALQTGVAQGRCDCKPSLGLEDAMHAQMPDPVAPPSPGMPGRLPGGMPGDVPGDMPPGGPEMPPNRDPMPDVGVPSEMPDTGPMQMPDAPVM